MKGKARFLLMLWFSGVTGFFLVLATIFISMIGTRNEGHIVYSEPNDFIFWTELGLIVFILAVTIWILYNYATGKGSLEFIEKVHARNY